MIEGATPILRVENLQFSLDFYIDVLGFKLDWRDRGIAGISRDHGNLMLCEGSQGQPGMWVWIGVDNVEPLYQEFLEARAMIRHAPQNYPWALEFKVIDPDGHILRFGSDSIEGRPFDEFSS